MELKQLQKGRLKKKIRFDLCGIAVVPLLLSYQANSRLVTLQVRDVPVESCKTFNLTARIFHIQLYLSILCGYISRVLCGR